MNDFSPDGYFTHISLCRLKAIFVMPDVFSSFRVLLISVAVVALTFGAGASAFGQERTTDRQTRDRIPSNQMVSFPPETSFSRFLNLINPVFEREEGKPIVDPENRSMPIGMPISGMHYFDAFERVLRSNNLTYQETDRVFLVQEATEEQAVTEETGQSSEGGEDELPATISSREIRIDATLFNINLTKVRNLGLNWSTILGSSGGSGGGGGGSGGDVEVLVNTENLFDSIDHILQPPEEVQLGVLVDFLRQLEQEDLGHTVANPEVTVQSGEQGEIQIGQDIPIQTQDFSGNTVTQFFSTGIIVDVTPTLISQPVADTSGAPMLDFIHMDIRVEDSNSSPSAAGPVINRNQATTQVLLLDGEATAIGGLTTSEKTTSRVGIPLLKDLPPWFFGLRYIFGSETTNVNERELLIVLRAEVVDPLKVRAKHPHEDEMIDERRRRAREAVRQLGERYLEESEFPEAETEEDGGSDR